MLFKCEECAKRHWTAAGRNGCRARHQLKAKVVGAQYGQGSRGASSNFRSHSMPLESYKHKPESTASNNGGLGFSDGVLAAMVLDDLLEATERSSDAPAEVEKPKLEPAPTYEAPREEYRPSAPSEDYSQSSQSSFGGSSLGETSSLGSSSLSDSWSSSDW